MRLRIWIGLSLELEIWAMVSFSSFPVWRRWAHIGVCEGPVGEIAEGYVGDGNTSLGIQRSELAEWLVGEAEKDDSRWIKGFPSVSTALKKKV